MGRMPVLFLNSSANRLDVEYPIIWAICPMVKSVSISR